MYPGCKNKEQGCPSTKAPDSNGGVRMSKGNVLRSLMRPSILKNVLLSFIGFGVVVGAAFPFFAGWFVEFNEGMKGWFIGSCLVAGVLMGVSNFFLLNAVLLRKLRRLADVADAIGNKDVSHKCTLVSHDLVGTIVDSINRMADNLRRTITEIAESSKQLSESSARMSAVTVETGRCMRTQQSEIEQVAAAMNEMTATVQEAARNAEQAAGATEEAERDARNGALIATEAMGGIDALVAKIEEVARGLEELRADSDNIGVVLDVIRGIAEQTNLLALNAAIEAARAGEQGRGFAVVADEVRTLASRTQHSTEEIHKMIERLQSKTGVAVKAMEQTRARAQEGIEQVEKAAETLAEISGAVQSINNMNAQIASAVEQQGAVAEEINGNIVSISQSSEQTAAGAQQTASASEQLNELSRRLEGLLAGFRL